MDLPDLEAARRLLAFCDAAPSPYHACATAAAVLGEAGFTRLAEDAAWPGQPGRWFLVRGGSLIAWATPAEHQPHDGFRILGAHTDSPNLRIKPRPDLVRSGARQLGIEAYGGVLLNSWLDRDLGLSGRVAVRRNGAGAAVRLLGVAADEVFAWDLMLHDLAPGALVGPDDELIGSARLDNLASCWAAIEALSDVSESPDGGPIPVVCLFDHEEIGSTSDRGAASSLLPNVLERIVLARGGDREALHRALARSACLSADMAHATHPNYADRHDPQHQVALNGGPAPQGNANDPHPP